MSLDCILSDLPDKRLMNLFASTSHDNAILTLNLDNGTLQLKYLTPLTVHLQSETFVSYFNLIVFIIHDNENPLLKSTMNQKSSFGGNFLISCVSCRAHLDDYLSLIL